MSINQAIAERFTQISRMIDLLGEDSFRASAHAKAARIIEDYATDLEPVATAPDGRKRLLEIDGVGPKIADKIIEFASTGKIKELEELKSRVPAGLLPLMEIPGLGPKTVSVLWNQGGVKDMAGLKKIIADGSILSLPRMGAKSVEKIKESIALAEQGSQRLYLGLAVPIADRIVERMLKVKGVVRAAFAGSLRRGKETIGDIDVLVSTTDAAGAGEAFRAMPDVVQVISSGDGRSSVRIAINPDSGRWKMDGEGDREKIGTSIQVDLRVIDESCWGAAMMYFTGSKEHNIALRERALKMGCTLSDYGLFPDDQEPEPPQKRGIKPIVSRTEEEIYKRLGLAWIPPEMREDRGEIEAFLLDGPNETNAAKAASRAKKAGRVEGKTAAGAASLFAPFDESALVTVEAIKAELHAHTTASDGRMSIVELAEQSKKRGFHTIAVTDHSKSSAIAGGLSAERLRQHIKDVHAARRSVPGINILAGSEVDILADGALDYDDDLLAELDIVVASPHTALGQDGATATKRLIRAVEHPSVRILGHPTGRLINKRAGLSPDMKAVIEAAVANNVALEINAHWLRLDLRDAHVRLAMELGALLAIDCDVHWEEDFDNLRFGVQTGRRGWLTKERCVNAWAQKRLSEWLSG